MTVVLQTTSYHWNVLSSDTWPTSGVSEGSTVHVIDTGEEYIYHDGTWEQDKRKIYALMQV